MSTAPSAPTFKKSVAREYLESVVIAILLALFIRTFIVQAFKIPSGSMESNLLIGDHLLVNRLIYSPSLGGWEDAVLGKRAIRRGDIIVFKYPQNPSQDFIKRVIGLPGESVAVRDKAVYIDGQRITEDYTFFGGGQGAPHKEDVVAPERLEDVRMEPPSVLSSSAKTRFYGPSVVPPGHLFVLGDNRDNSRDSRDWEFLSRDLVKGRALLVYWSYEATRDEYNRTGAQWWKDTLSALGKTRWNRFFHIIR
jgi:signal peptidase I